jgi:hypothetical protein
MLGRGDMRPNTKIGQASHRTVGYLGGSIGPDANAALRPNQRVPRCLHVHQTGGVKIGHSNNLVVTCGAVPTG